MSIRLKKLDLPSFETIKAMDKGDLLPLAKQCIDRIKVYESLLFKARREKYGPSSERSDRPKDKDPKPKSPREPTAKKPSDRYPDARVEVVDVNFPAPPPAQLVVRRRRIPESLSCGFFQHSLIFLQC